MEAELVELKSFQTRISDGLGAAEATADGLQDDLAEAITTVDDVSITKDISELP